MKISIIMPVYNEAKTISRIIQKVMAVRLNKELIIVDDGSNDGTQDFLKVIKHPNIKVIFHHNNKGKGYAIRTALARVTGNIVIIQDADLEYNPEDYHKLIKPVLDGKSKVVYGSRFTRKNPYPYHLDKFYLATRILTFLTNLLYSSKITDESTCYKVFDAKLLKSIKLECKRFEFCPEITAKVLKKKLKIIEVPISYSPRTPKQGKKINWKDGFQAFWALIKYRFKD